MLPYPLVEHVSDLIDRLEGDILSKAHELDEVINDEPQEGWFGATASRNVPVFSIKCGFGHFSWLLQDP